MQSEASAEQSQANKSQERVLRAIRKETFLKPLRMESAKSFVLKAPFAPLMLIGVITSLVKGLGLLNADKTAVYFRKNNRELQEAKLHERDPAMIGLYEKMAELNELGIDQVMTAKEKRRLLKTCKRLKTEAVAQRSRERSDEFLKSANDLYVLREHWLDVLTKKNKKQEEITRLIKEMKVLRTKDAYDLAKTGAIDIATHTGYATAAKLGDISAKLIVKQIQKQMMSPRLLRSTIRLSESCQSRYITWKSSLHEPPR